MHQDMAAMYLSHRRDSGSDRKAEDAKGCIKVILKVLGRDSRIIKWGQSLGKDQKFKIFAGDSPLTLQMFSYCIYTTLLFLGVIGKAQYGTP